MENEKDNTASTQESQQKRRLNMVLDSFTMFATPRVRTSKKTLRLYWGVTNGFPNVNVEVDEEAEPTLENGFLRVSSRLNSTNFYGYLILLEKALTQESGWKQGIECYHTYKDGVRHDNPIHVNDLIVGVDNQGLVYTTILQNGRTTVKFVFGPTEWHNYKKEDGSSWSQKDINHLCVKATVDGLRSVMGALTAIDAYDNQLTKASMPSPSTKAEGAQQGFNKPQNPGNNQGGGNSNYNRNNYRSGGGGGYNKGGYNKGSYNNNNRGGYNKSNYNKGNYNNNNNQGGNRNFDKGFRDNNSQGSQGSNQSTNTQNQESFDDIEF